MKKIFSPESLKKTALVFIGLAIHFINIAQDNTAGVPAATPGSEQGSAWYNETWFWIAGASISVLVVVALVKMGTNKSRTK